MSKLTESMRETMNAMEVAPVRSDPASISANQEWKVLSARIVKFAAEWIELKNDVKAFYRALPYRYFVALNGKRQGKIIKKLNHFGGDVTPSMFNNLVKDVANIEDDKFFDQAKDSI